MRTRSSILVAVLCFTLVLSSSMSPQAPAISTVVYASDNSIPNNVEAGMLESAVPRDGLQFYFEVRQGGFAQLAQSGAALAPLLKTLAGPMKLSAQDFAGFAVSQMGALSRSRFALANYGGSDTAALIEAASPADAESIRAGLARLVGSSKAASDAGLEVSLRDQLVVAGIKNTVSRLAGSADTFPLAEDQEFMKARARFASDPFFAYAELSSNLMPARPGAEQNAAYMAGFLTGLASRPHAMVMGGSFQGDSVHIRALALFGPKKTGGLLAEIFSTAESPAGKAVAASFAPQDADMFFDLMVNWDKLYDSLQSMFNMAAAAMGPGMQSESPTPSLDLLGAAESQFGFSIRHDLLPTLGNELAISFANFASVMKPAPQPSTYDSAQPQGPASMALPRILLMVELRDPVKFEKLFMRIMNPANRPAVEFAQETYRGAVIKSRPAVAFTISKGFFLLAPTAAEIRRALAARALGNGLAASAQFRAAVGSAEQATMQGYFSPGLAHTMLKSIFAEAMKANEALKDFASASARTRSAFGIAMWPDSEGLMMEMHVPSSFAVMGIAAMATTKPAPYGITSSSQRRPAGRRTPKLTDEDVRSMRKP